MQTYRNTSRTPAAPGFLGQSVREWLGAAPKACKACRVGATAMVAAMALSACATQEIDRPVAQMTRADTAIQNAIQAGARDSAPMELQNAQDHYRQAQQASTDEQYSQALQFAERAEADAELAQAKARTAEAYETVAELEEGIRALQEETERDSNF